jgi:sulfopyruvate decarboxylase subunit beta
VLMNPGTFITLSRHRPPNLLHVIFDNATHLSIGGFPTATATGTNLAAIAAASGVPYIATAASTDEFVRAFDAALAARELATLVAKVEPVGPATYVTGLGLLENRFAFQRALEASRRPEA